MKTSQQYFDEDKIHITSFPVKIGDGYKFRFYFTDLGNSYIHNPLIKNELGKSSYNLYDDYYIGLSETLKEIDTYINKK